MGNPINWSVTPPGSSGDFSGFTYAIYIMLPIKLNQEYRSLTVIGVGDGYCRVILSLMSGLYNAGHITYSLISLLPRRHYHVIGIDYLVHDVFKRNELYRTGEE